MAGKTKTIYLKSNTEETIVNEAKRFAAYHENKTLGDLFIEKCKEIVHKYSPNHQHNEK